MAKAKGKKNGPPVVPESEVQKAIMDALEWMGALVFRLNSGVAFVKRGEEEYAIHLCPEGTPDVMAIMPNGRVVWVECKTTIGKLRPAQKKMIADLRERGQLVVVGRSVDDLMKALGYDAPFAVVPGAGLALSNAATARERGEILDHRQAVPVSQPPRTQVPPHPVPIGGQTKRGLPKLPPKQRTTPPVKRPVGPVATRPQTVAAAPAGTRLTATPARLKGVAKPKGRVA